MIVPITCQPFDLVVPASRITRFSEAGFLLS
jgi:hypothetical protein